MLNTNGKRVRFLFNLMRPAEYGTWIKKQDEFADLEGVQFKDVAKYLMRHKKFDAYTQSPMAQRSTFGLGINVPSQGGFCGYCGPQLPQYESTQSSLKST